MNTLQTIYNKLQDKTELAKHEVELNTINDFTKEASRTILEGALLKKEDADIQKKLDLYFKLKSDLNKEKKSLEDNLKNIEVRIHDINAGNIRTSKIYQDLVNKASDLGIAYPKSIDANMKEIENLVQYTKSVSPKNVKL